MMRKQRIKHLYPLSLRRGNASEWQTQTRRGVLLFVAFVALCVPARAADMCLTLPQARAAFPGKHLWWHYDAARKQCWDASAPSHNRRVGQHRALTPLQTSVPVPRSTVLWPALSLTATPVDAALLTPESATAWPLLLDVDEITGGPVADCCWPALDEPPFRERWFALPSNWFELIGGMK